MTLSTLIKRLKDIMRQDSGVDGDAQRLSQLVWLIFLKVMDSREEEAEWEEDYEPVIPEGYRWRDWAVGKSVKNQLTGEDLLNFVNNELIPVLSGNAITKDGRQVILFDKEDPKSLLVKDVMKDVTNFMKNGYLLRQVINLLNEVEFGSTEDAHEFNDIYETLLKGLQSAGGSGEFYTPRGVTAWAVKMIDPQLGGVVADWSAGTGGFLIDALEHLKKQAAKGGNKETALLQKSLRGGEIKPLPYKLDVTNQLLHGIDLPNLRYGDSLAEKKLSDFRDDDLVDYEITNVPFGGVALPEDLNSFPADLRSSETADMFVALNVKRLKKGGKGMIVLPDGFLFGSDNAKQNIKKYLMEECNLHTVIRLPQSVFAPYTSIATNLLFFDKTGSTKDIWFYRMDRPEGYKHFSKTKPIRLEHFAPVEKWWNNRTEIEDENTDTYKAKKYSIEEIKENGWNLDLCGYPTEEKEILPPQDLIRQYEQERAALNSEIDEVLRQITESLGFSLEELK